MAKRHQHDKKNTAAREDVARAMNSEMLVCDIEPFLEDYGPSPGIQNSDVSKCKQYLLEAEILSKTEEDWRWKELLANPSCYPDLTDNEVFQPLETIVQGIWEFAKASKMSQNPYHFQLVPEKNLDDMIGGGDHLNACLLEQSYKSKIPNDIILVPWELKKEWTKTRHIKVQVLGDCHHILCEDARRMFIYGVTMEDNRCSVWYFSRSHSVQSMPFLWNYMDGIDYFIHLILSFACATPQSLGIDPHVFKTPVVDEDGLQQYVYEFEVPKDSIKAIPSPVGLGTHTSSTKEAAADKVTVYYRTVKGRVPMRPLCISGRITRVWEVVQVASVSDLPAANAQRVILKDVWLDKSASTEGENLRFMFEAVEQFIADANSGRGGIRNVLDTDPRFQYFEDSTKERLAALLTGGKYKDLFLTQILEWHGDVTKPRSPRASPPSIPSQPRKIHASRIFSQKRQVRLVYKEVCTDLDKVPTLGDVLHLLRQALDALQIFFCAGWLHRDISMGNIMALPSADGKGWQVKVGDLELSRPMGEHLKHRNDARTGTPFYMAVEIMRGDYLAFLKLAPTNPGRAKKIMKVYKYNATGIRTLATRFLSESPNHPDYNHYNRFRHDALPANITSLPTLANHDDVSEDYVSYNYQHDLESLWWLILYFITAGVGYDKSQELADRLFERSMEPAWIRLSFLTNSFRDLDDNLAPDLEAFKQPMWILGESLNGEYVERFIFKENTNHASYSYIHALFAEQLDLILADNLNDWKSVSVAFLANGGEECNDYNGRETPDVTRAAPATISDEEEIVQTLNRTRIV